jgi:nucleotide-binding universal stress UspA family protein
MGQTKRILVPVDGSDASLEAAKYAIRISKLLDAEIVCIHIIDTPALIKSMNPALVALYFTQAEGHAKKWVGNVETLAKKAKVPFTSEIPIEDLSVPIAITQYARKQKIDLIIMGTRGRTSPRNVLLGSVANFVVMHASCPVLLVR